ncbi:MAG: DNA gyrase inhibitor YacG [Acidobacteriota bacterium]|nr:DNA gyrase inhibitor YacG [Acidobacteriota bacterium]
MGPTNSKSEKPRCPICRREIEKSASYPFCSERCRLIDLGNWLGGRYRISSPAGAVHDPAASESNSGKDVD